MRAGVSCMRQKTRQPMPTILNAHAVHHVRKVGHPLKLASEQHTHSVVSLREHLKQDATTRGA